MSQTLTSNFPKSSGKSIFQPGTELCLICGIAKLHTLEVFLDTGTQVLQQEHMPHCPTSEPLLATRLFTAAHSRIHIAVHVFVRIQLRRTGRQAKTSICFVCFSSQVFTTLA